MSLECLQAPWEGNCTMLNLNARRAGGLALATLVTFLGATTTASATNFFNSGHGDIEILYDDIADEFEFEILCEDCVVNGIPTVGESEFEADDIILMVPPSTATTAVGDIGPIDDTPTGAAPGSTFYKLPETEFEADAEVAPFIGWGLDEIPAGIFLGDELTVTLLGVSFTGLAGSAELSMYSADAGLGAPVPHFWFSTSDPSATVNGDNTLVFDVPSHSHFNLGFTEKGLYELTVMVEGDLVAGGSTSGTGTITFLVPEPGTGLLVGLGLVAVARRRRGARRV